MKRRWPIKRPKRRDETRAFVVDLEVNPPTDQSSFRRMYEKWVGRANIEALLLMGEVYGWEVYGWEPVPGG